MKVDEDFFLRYKAVIFDFDGTIADILPHLPEIVKKVEKKFDLKKISKEKIEKARGQSLIRTLIDFKIPFWDMLLVVDFVKEIQKKEIDKLNCIYGLKTVLEDMSKAGMILGILTSNSEENVREFIIKSKMKCFRFVHSEKNPFGKHKSLLHITDLYDLSISQTLYVGDEIRDISACKRIGMDIASVTWGLNNEDILINYDPTYIVSKPSELRHIVGI